jgi:hypothetical protein
LDAYPLRFRAAIRPAKPIPNKANVLGSGTAAKSPGAPVLHAGKSGFLLQSGFANDEVDINNSEIAINDFMTTILP